MLSISTQSLLAADRPGRLGLWAGRLLALGYRLTGRACYDDFRLENVHGMPVLVLPTVANPVALRTGALLAEQIGRLPLAAESEVLDLGTGSGVCALFAARQSEHVVATDLSPNAVRCASVNALMNGLEHRIDFRQGDLFAPVEGERFDLVLFNPPFLLGKPANDREAAWRSDDLARRFAADLGRRLKPGGTALLALSTFGDACPSFESELKARGFCLGLFARRRWINETVIILEARPRSESSGS